MRRKAFGSEIAISEFVFQPADGLKQRVKVRVGKPYKVSAAEWACPVEIRGFERRYADVRGGDALQALSLAISLVRSRIEDFIAKGGKVLDADDGSEWDEESLTAVFGGR